MNKFIFFLLLLTGLQLHAQHKSYLPECKDAEFPKSCTTDKLQAEIGALITKDMFLSMQAGGKEYFTVEAIFIVDETGKVIPDEIRFLSEIETLKEPVIKHIKNLPTFVPTESSEKDKRDVYILILDYIINDDRQGYHLSVKGEHREKHIKPTYLKFDEYPVYPGCEGIYDSDQMCMVALMYKKIVSKFRIPYNTPDGQVKMIVTFIINEVGEIEVSEITGGSKDFQREIKRVLGKLPKLSPAKISGIPLRMSFNLPVTVNVS